ncbi:hypothetical protein FRC09_003249 [Ceratobasidium sp. 395]|nr:hypothetical protein FRC09_003249 [Ceratobasidium sp. 395]
MSSDWVDPSDDWSNVKDDFGQFLKDCDPDKWDNLPPLDLDDAPPTSADILNLAGLHRGNKKSSEMDYLWGPPQNSLRYDDSKPVDLWSNSSFPPMSSTSGAPTARPGTSSARQQFTENDPFLTALNTTTNKSRWAQDKLPEARLPPELADDEAATRHLLNLAGINEGSRMGVSFVHRLQGTGGGNTISGRQYMANAQAGMDLDDDFGALFQPTVNDRKRSMELRWAGFLIWIDATIPPNKFWNVSVLAQYWESFFYALVDLTPGRSGDDGRTLRASTVYEWSKTWTTLVKEKCTDDAGGLAGHQLLYRQGVFNRLKNRVLWFTHHFQLDRHVRHQSFVGRPALLMMMRAGYQKSEVYGRVPFQQSCVALSLVCQIGCRMGSLGYSTKTHLKREMYAKLEDIKIIRVSKCRWRIIFTLKHRKGHNWVADAGHPSKFTLEPVTKVHNLWFDFGVHLVSFLFMRGAIQGCETLQDVFDSEAAELKIKPDMLKQPLFLARTQKGEDVTDNPASAKGMTKTLQVLADLCGYYDFTSHGLRRDLGDRLGLLLGNEVAREVLTHDEDRTTYHRSYSRNTLNIPVTLAMEGELDANTSTVNQLTLRRNSVTDTILNSIIDSIASICSEPSSESDQVLVNGRQLTVVLTEEEMQKANDDKHVAAIQSDLDSVWETYYEMMPDRAKITHGQKDVESIGKAFERYQNSDEYKGNQEALEKIHTKLIFLGGKRSDALKAVVRRMRAEKKKQMIEERDNATRTTDQKDKAREKAEELMRSDKNLPDLDVTRLSMTAESIAKGNFGQGVLTPEAILMLSSTGLVNKLLSEQISDTELAQELAEKEPSHKLDDNQNGIEIQDNVEPFTDKHEKQIFKVDMVDAVQKFMITMNLPVELMKIDKKRAESNKGKFKCEVCANLPENQRTGRYKKALLKAAMFDTRTKLGRHLESHTEWQKLAQFMCTESTTQFKCPIQECGLRFSTIKETQEHCVTDCPDHAVFQSLKKAHDTRSRGVGTGPRTSLKARKVAAELAQGLPLDDSDTAVLDWYTNLTEDQIEQLALRYEVDSKDLKVIMPEIKAALEEARQYIRDGKIYAPELTHTDATAEDDASIDDFLDGEDVTAEMELLGMLDSS